MQPFYSFILLSVTLVLFLPWHDKMSALKKVSIFCFIFSQDNIFGPILSHSVSRGKGQGQIRGRGKVEKWDYVDDNSDNDDDDYDDVSVSHNLKMTSWLDPRAQSKETTSCTERESEFWVTSD